jgi:uncharacterized protein YeaO (DUF488 family)
MAARADNAGRPEHNAGMAVAIKRIYEPVAKGDGYRVLVDRIWPRGVSKGEATLDEWLKDVAPSTALRQWFGHDPARWAEFQRRYRKELDGNPEARQALASLRKRKGRVTLLYAARDEEHNNAVVLQGLLGAK